MNIGLQRSCLAAAAILSFTLVVGAASSSLVADAARNKDVERVRALLREKADVNAPQGDGATALAWASYWDDAETAELLIQAGANPNAVNDYGVSPLTLACGNGSAAMVGRLLKAGANPRAAQKNGQTPLMICAHTGGAEAVRLLLDRGAGIDAKENNRGQTALMAAAAGNHPDVVQTLLDRGADVQARTETGFTALMFAAQQGDVVSMEKLLSNGARIDDQSPAYGSALTVASASHQEKAALFLLERGADPNIADGNGITPLHYAEARGIGDMIGTGRDVYDGHYKPRPTNMPELGRALIAHRADVNAQIQKSLITWWTTEAYRGPSLPRDAMVGATPFLLAAVAGDAPMMRALLAAGANPRTPSKGGVTALVAAAGGGWDSYRSREEKEKALEAVKVLIDLGLDVNQSTTAGQTPMHAAAYTASDSIIRLLASKGANPNVRNNGGETPWSMASGLSPNSMSTYASHDATAALLIELGAVPFTAEQIEIVKREGFRALTRRQR